MFLLARLTSRSARSLARSIGWGSAAGGRITGCVPRSPDGEPVLRSVSYGPFHYPRLRQLSQAASAIPARLINFCKLIAHTDAASAVVVRVRTTEGVTL